MNITLRQLQAFTLAAKHKTFSRAAMQMGITQSGFSLLIQELEQQIGAKLFDRTTRWIALTSAGLDFLPKINRILNELDDALDELADLEQMHRGIVSLAALPSVAACFLPPHLREFGDSYPNITIQIREAHADELLKLIETEGIDIAFGTRPPKSRNLNFHLLARDNLIAVLHPDSPLASCSSVSCAELASQPYISLSGTSSVRHLADSTFRRSQVSISPRYDVLAMPTAVAFVQVGLGFTLLPDMALEMLRTDGLSLIPLSDQQSHRDIGIIWSRRRTLNKATRIFLETLIAAASHSRTDQT
jgi:LysR family transcriptional regulator, carnitine catabolism transcriptional activator